ncbi:MAG: hypothetical protein O2931_15055 [Planctomycetota bacterium]|nr:hypothetical protein [Planctomycetota bacterium]
MMSKKIAAAEIGDMPSFTTTMQLGLSSLKKSDAAAKHMIIISDGDPSPPPPEMIAEFQQEKISVSMVAIFPHGGSDISKMRAIAETTGGRYYNPSDPSKLPSIFIKEAKTLRRSMIQNKEVTVESISSPILKGIDAMPSLKGYVLASQKPRANAVLQVTVTEGGEEQVDPILSTWRFGLGSSAAFTSDLSPNWAANWMDWEKRRAFVAQLLTEVARVEQTNSLHVWTEVQGNEAVIIAEDHHPQDSFLNVTARISGPRERSESVVLQQSGPRRYQASVPLWGKGRYQVMVQGTGGGRQEQVPANWVVSYSPEYLRFRSNPLVLDRIRDVTQGVALDADSGENVIYGRREAKRSSRPIFDWFLVALAGLVPIDVALRRIQVDFGAIRQVFRRKGSRADTTPTMGTLLERKKEVAHQWQDRGESKPLTSRPGSMSPQTSIRSTNPTPPKPSAAPSSTSESAPPNSAPENSSTTEKLLNLKRKRDQQNPP